LQANGVANYQAGFEFAFQQFQQVIQNFKFCFNLGNKAHVRKLPKFRRMSFNLSSKLFHWQLSILFIFNNVIT